IAARLRVPVDKLVERNNGKLQTWTTARGHRIQGFNAGDKIAIPTSLLPNTPARGAAATAAPTGVTMSGVTMDYGTAMAMADFYETPETMLAAPTAEMQTLHDLVAAEAKDPKSVTEAQWQA